MIPPANPAANPPLAPPDSGPPRRSHLRLLAGLPIPILLLAMLALWVPHLHGSYGSASLIMALNLIFSLLTSLLIVFLVSRSFLTRGMPGLLLLGCGVLTWGAAGVVAKVVIQGDANTDVTIHNTCVWLSALFHFGSALLLLRPRRAVQARELWLGAAYAVTMGLLVLVVLAALHGWTPVFFVQGAGGTTVRQFVLESAIVMFLLTAGLLKGANRRPLPTFLYWYSLALGLIAVGLFGIMIESVFASLLSWVGLVAQYLSGVYMLIAAIASVRESGAWHISLEAALRESEERLRLLVDGTKDCALFMLDPQGRITTWTEGGRRLKGYEAEEVIGRHFSLFYTPEDVAAGKPARELDVALREGMYEEEGERVRKDGSRFWASVLISPLRDERGRLRGFSKVIRDITNRKQAEAALRDSEKRLGAIVGSAMDAIVSVDADQRIVLFNVAAERMFGYRAQDAVGQPLHTLLPSDRRAAHDEHVRAFAATGVTARQMGALGEVAGLRANGEQFPIEASISQVEVAGQKLLTVILRDITERKRAEASLRESREHLESSLREKEVLLKEIHHRVKNNLQVISSLVDLQVDILKEPALRAVLTEMRDRVRSMALVHEKLYQSQNLAHVEFAEYTRSLLSYLTRANRTSETTVRFKLDLQPVSLLVDTAVPCGLILNELVTNAFKHAFRDRAEGEITAALGTGPDGRVCLRVSDDGVGLPAGVDLRRSRSLGLRLIHLLARQLDATVEVRTAAGTEFVITLPKSQSTPVAIPQGA